MAKAGNHTQESHPGQPMPEVKPTYVPPNYKKGESSGEADRPERRNEFGRDEAAKQAAANKPTKVNNQSQITT